MRSPDDARSLPRGLSILLPALLLGACAPPPVVVVAPALDPEQTALALETRTSLEQPLRIVFDWQLNEQGVRVKGRGVARVEPPYRARLDLFMENNELAAQAALVNGELRLPPGAPDDFLPPPDLMWGVLGVFRPEFGTQLIGGDELEGGAVRLRYRYGDGTELHYGTKHGILERVELLESGHVVQRVEIDLEENGRYPVEATYRNMADFRELKIIRDRLERVEPYPPDIWFPMYRTGGERPR